MQFCRVALIDDSPAYLAIAADFLRGDPRLSVVGQFKNATEAIAMLPTLGVDVVLTDFSLPGINGIDAIRLIRAQRHAPHVILVSLHDSPELRRRAAEAGAAGYVTKDCVARELVPLIVDLWQASAAPTAATPAGEMPPLAPAPRPANERARLEALHASGALELPPAPLLDEVVALARRLCGTSAAFLSLVDADRQILQVRNGTALKETPRDLAFCSHTILGEQLLVVPDAGCDPRFAGNPLVTGEPAIRFYAGMPLVNPDGYALGALCVIDGQPRQLTAEQAAALETLAHVVMQFLQQSRLHAELLLAHEHERAQEIELQRSERRHAMLFEHHPRPLWVYDVDTLRFLAVNKAAIASYGYSREEFLAMTLRDIRPAEDVPVLLKDLSQQPPAHDRLESDGWRHRRKDGTILHVEIASYAVEFDGRPARLVAPRDVTEQRTLWERLQKTQRMENLGLLAAGIAHDFNNILAPMLMIAQLLERGNLSATDQRLLDTLQLSAERGAALVRQILDFSRGDSGAQIVLQPKTVARDVALLIEETFPGNIEFRQFIPTHLWPIRANASQLHQIILNLCVNARDAMRSGGVLRLELANCHLGDHDAATIPGARPGNFLQLLVADTGTGIAPEILNQIWEPFFTTKAPGVGTGLGLSTVRGIVTDHDGFVSLSSHVGAGTTIRIFLPALPDGPAGGAQPPAVQLTEGHGEHLLVVDDEPAVGELIHATLTRRGYRVTLAKDGLDAIDHLTAPTADPWRLVITDLDMPRLGGEGLAAFARKRFPQVRILFVTGSASGSDSHSTNPAGEPTLVKPFSPEALIAAVQTLLR